MVLYNIYNEPVERNYRAHVCSFATLFNIGVGLLTFVTPLFVAFHSYGFWKVEDFFREQPLVNYRHEFVFLAQGSETNTILGYSTYPKLNFILKDSIRIPKIASTEYDSNLDGKMDYLSVSISLPLSKAEMINKIQLILVFDYALKKYPNVRMQSLANIQYESASPGFEFFTEGDLKLKQKTRLLHAGSHVKFNRPIFNASSDTLQSWDLPKVLSEYQARNISTDFIGRYPVWKSGRTYGKPFNLKAKIFYPEEQIFYQPGVWQLLKVAWIQYLAILFIFIIVLRELKKFVYTNRLVRTFAVKLHVD